MNCEKLIPIIGLVLFLSFGLNASSDPDQKQINQWMKNDIGFEQNFGQIKDFNGEAVQDVLFSAKLQDYSIFITKDGVSVVMYQFEKSTNVNTISHESKEELEIKEVRYARYDLNLVNGTIDADNIILEQPVQGMTNYYLGDTRATQVKAYRMITLKDVYPGIDWVWRFDDEMHHEFVVQPGADPDQIKLAVKWADVDIEDDGKTITFTTPLGKITDGPLYAFEKTGKNEVDIRYHKLENNHLSFSITDYDKDEVLVIDPPLTLQWATFYGGGQAERGMSITTDVSGSIFITGNTTSSDFPTENPEGGAYFDGTFNGNPDVIILKFTNAGVLEWATYYGGADFDYGESITTDISGNIFITGQTNSPNLPTQDPGGGAYFDNSTNGQSDSFVLKFTNDGILEWGTYFGGNKSETGFSINTDYLGNVFVVGKTRSTNFPTLDPGNGAYYDYTNNGNYDVFILKFTNSGILEWATNYGGGALEWGESAAVDALGNLFVMGRTESTDLPLQDPGDGAYFDDTHNGLIDSFILKFTDGGVLEWATFYGGTQEDWIHASTIDDLGNLYITGETLSNDMPTLDPGSGAYYDDTHNGSYDAFILKFTGNGAPLWATYYGAEGFDFGISMTTDDSGSLFILGSTSSPNFPTLDPGDGTYFDGTYHGFYDMFMLEFNNDGKRQWATYYGGGNYDFAQSITLDGLGGMFVTGSTLSADFPTLDPGGDAYFDDTYNSPELHDIILLKFYNGVVEELIADFQADITVVATGNGVVFADNTIGNPISWLWSFEGGTPDTFDGEVPPTVVYNQVGTWDVSLEVTDGVTTNTKLEEDFITVGDAPVADFEADATEFVAGASTNFTSLSTGDDLTFAWIFEEGSPENSSDENPMDIFYYIQEDATYDVTLTVTNIFGESTMIKDDYIHTTPSGVGLIDNNNIDVYPNPSQGTVHVVLGELEGVNIRVFDILGNVIYYKSNINTPKFHFNLGEPAGVYLIEINAANKSQRYKLIIK